MREFDIRSTFGLKPRSILLAALADGFVLTSPNNHGVPEAWKKGKRYYKRVWMHQHECDYGYFTDPNKAIDWLINQHHYTK